MNVTIVVAIGPGDALQLMNDHVLHDWAMRDNGTVWMRLSYDLAKM